MSNQADKLVSDVISQRGKDEQPAKISCHCFTDADKRLCMDKNQCVLIEPQGSQRGKV